MTVKELGEFLSSISQEEKECEIYSICGCVEGSERKPGFQIHVLDSDGKNKYIIVPKNKNEKVYDSFGAKELK